MRCADWTGLPPDEPPWIDGANEGTGSNLRGHPDRVPVGPGDQDGDGDGVADTVVVRSGEAFSLFTDLDGDGLADRRLTVGTVGPDGLEPEDTFWDALGDLLDAALGR